MDWVARTLAAIGTALLIGLICLAITMEETTREGADVTDFSHEALMVQTAWQEAAGEQMRPCVLFRPTLKPDGDQWCALYGDNLHDGCAGFGDTPSAAMADFDRNWTSQTLGSGK